MAKEPRTLDELRAERRRAIGRAKRADTRIQELVWARDHYLRRVRDMEQRAVREFGKKITR